MCIWSQATLYPALINHISTARRDSPIKDTKLSIIYTKKNLLLFKADFKAEKQTVLNKVRLQFFFFSSTNIQPLHYLAQTCVLQLDDGDEQEKR